jgi:N-acetylglutamate synthase-like GNAT family acetyltransferase
MEDCANMAGVRISYLVDYPEYIPQLAQWLFEEWGAILGEKTLEARIKKLKAHMNGD